MKNRTRFLTYSAIIAALYTVLCYLQNFIFPNSASMAIQMRAAEALCVLAFFTPAAIPGLSLGCLLFNLTSGAALPLDPIIGTVATILATSGMWLLRKATIKGYPFPGLLLPALFNGFLVGWELTVYIGGGFWLNALYLAIGEAAGLLTPEEQQGAKKTLKAAALTYVAATATAIAQLLRLIVLFGGRRRRD